MTRYRIANKFIFSLIFLALAGFFGASTQPVAAEYNPFKSTPAQDFLLKTYSEEESCVFFGCCAGEDALQAGDSGYRVSGGILASLTKLVNNLTSVGGPNYEQFRCLTLDPENAVIDDSAAFTPGLGGIVLGFNVNLMQQRPASAVVFALQQWDKFAGTTPVYAQDSTNNPTPYFPGTGYEALQPIQAFWGWAVTISYSLLVLVIIVVAFALLFRQRLSGGQVIQIQNAIPNIVLAMILIPLSYPLSGLFIDAVTLGSNVVHDFLFTGSGLGATAYTAEAPSDDQTPLNSDRGLYIDDERLSFLKIGFQFDIGTALFGDREDNKLLPSCDTTACDVVNGVTSTLGWIVDTIASLAGTDGFFSEFINLIFNIVFLFTGLRIGWKLFKKFLMVIIYPAIAPFIFATIALPGRGTSTIMTYVNRMMSFTAAYLVTYTMFLVAIILTSSAFINSAPGLDGYKYIPPIIGGAVGLLQPGGSAVISSSAAIVFILAGIGIYLMIPQTLDRVDEILKTSDDMLDMFKKPYSEFQTSYRQALGTVGVGMSAIGTAGTLTAGAAGGVNRQVVQRYQNARIERAKDVLVDVTGRPTGGRRSTNPFSTEKTLAEYRNEQQQSRVAARQAEFEAAGPIGKIWRGARLSYATNRAKNVMSSATGGDVTKLDIKPTNQIELALTLDEARAIRGGIIELDAASIVGTFRGSTTTKVYEGKLVITPKQSGDTQTKIFGREVRVNYKATPRTFVTLAGGVFTAKIIAADPSKIPSKPFQMDKIDIPIKLELEISSGYGALSVESVSAITMSTTDSIQLAVIRPDNSSITAKISDIRVLFR